MRLKSLGLKLHLSRKLKDISTPNFSTPWLKNSWLKSPGLKSLGLKIRVEKSKVEMSFIPFKDIVNANETQPTLDDEIDRIPLDIPAKCSKKVRAVMKKCLDKDPQKRYTFEEIVAKLTELQQTDDSILKEQHYTKIQLLNPVMTEPESQVESKIVADLKKNEGIDTKLEDKIELIVNGNENHPDYVSYSFHILLISQLPP